MMKNESGRSMVEMLGVLAIIGVLSVGGIAGYSMAMKKYRVNTALDCIAKVSVMSAVQSEAATMAQAGCPAVGQMGNCSISSSGNYSGNVSVTGCSSEVQADLQKLLHADGGKYYLAADKGAEVSF